MYAIVDIETTGSKYPGNSIIDLGILLHDGRQIVQTWQSLFKPAVPIPPFVVELTGITEEMVAQAPLFQQHAADIFALLRGTTFVAHDVNFDYLFLRHELQEAGYDLDLPKICTLKNSRKFLPGHPSYSLGKLCKELGIEVSDRHRALGDATATASLFDLLLPHLAGYAHFLSDGTASEVSLAELVRISTPKKQKK
ncbi:MAG: DNA polymerase III subunit epsilon [Sphingobacteriaceae bacterium]|nr:DNA polymerase III subunit epsilon [Sphingobacteriaceae bacterium]